MIKSEDKVIIKNKRTVRRLMEGHKWIFSNELVSLPELPPGTLVTIQDNESNNYGLGFYNRNSLISCRLLNSDYFDKNLIYQRIKIADNFRKQLFYGENSYRLVFSESDLLPGLIIDKYENYFVIQVLSAGMEFFKNEIKESICEIFPDTKGIIFRNDSYWRTIEGLNNMEEIGFGEIPEKMIISENGIKYEISLTDGQKTGFFFDQRLNRQILRNVSRDKSVLDLFSNQGGFALNASIGLAENVFAVDISETAMKMAEKNAELNSLENCEFISNDVFEFLKEQISQNQKYDIIICDPPAFSKNKKSVNNAIIAYKRVNKMAMQCIQDGILFTSSCSQHIDEETFLRVIQNSANEAKKEIRLFYRGSQSPDHPILPSMKETNYLKFFGFTVW
jgi:23S rRNA (cytosine1962-C5)-methyltransferase